MHKYRLTPSAKSDLIEIWSYTVETWGEKQAEKYLQDIEDKLNQLAANPELGRQRPEISPGYDRIMKSSGLGNFMIQSLLMLFFGLVLLAPGLMQPGGLAMTP